MALPTPSPSPVSSTMPQASPTSLSPPENCLNVFAQKLNNSAALCIEVGEYDRAIWSLQRALRLSEKHTIDMKKGSSQQQANRNSSREQFTLDGCIAFSEANSLFSSTNDKSRNTSLRRLNATVNATSAATNNTNVVRHGNKRRRTEITPLEENKQSKKSNVDAVPTSIHDGYTSNDDDIDSAYYVYTKPIRVPRQGEEMGSVLFLVILFNLALAHHLKATTMSAVRHPSPSHFKELSKVIDKSLMLYQLVFEYWSKLQQRLEENTIDHQYESSVGNKTNNYSSIWFRMILHNNLGQIYQWTEKPTKEHECLQDLLSTVMLATDQSIQHGTNLAVPKGFQRDMEGFLANTAALTAHEICAEAA